MITLHLFHQHSISEPSVVITDGSLVTVTANSVENAVRTFNFLFCNIPFIVFSAMRDGGAGSWGVIVSATFQTFPTFDTAAPSLS